MISFPIIASLEAQDTAQQHLALLERIAILEAQVDSLNRQVLTLENIARKLSNLPPYFKS